VEKIAGVTHDLAEGSIQMGERFGGTCEPHLRTQVVSTFLAHRTALAVDSDLHSDPVSDFEGGRCRLVWSKGSDDTARLVTEHHWCLDLECSVGSVAVVVH
jgi:hypothetical protein